jgi:hypothetical protein
MKLLIALVALSLPTFAAVAQIQPVPPPQLPPTEPIDMQLGRQPDAIHILSPGMEPRNHIEMPRGETGPWHFMFTVLRERLSDTGRPEDYLSTARFTHAEILLDVADNQPDDGKRAYTIILPQVVVDWSLSQKWNRPATTHPAPDAFVYPPQEGPYKYTRVAPSMDGTVGTLVMDREGWIDSLTFDFADNADNESIDACLAIERGLRNMLTPVPAAPVGFNADWAWRQHVTSEGVRMPVVQTVKNLTSSINVDNPVVELIRVSSVENITFDGVPVLLANMQPVMQSATVGYIGGGTSKWKLNVDASPLPDGSATVATGGQYTWRDRNDESGRDIIARSNETETFTLEMKSEPLAPFAVEPPRVYDVDPLAIDSPTNFDQAVGFMERQLADLDLALEPGGAESRAQVGEGEPLDVSLQIAVGTPLRAKILVEEMTQQESQLATIDEITAFRVDAEITATIETEDPQLGWRGTLTIDKASGIWLEKLAVGEPERVIAPQPALATFVGKPIAFSITSLGMVVVETNDLAFATDLDYRYVLTAIADGFKQVQIDRPFDPLRMGQTTVLATAEAEPEGVRNLKTLTLEGTTPRVLRQVETLRAQIREKDLFTLTPVIVDARVVTTYYHHLVIEDADTWLPARARRRDIHRTTATYERAGQPGTGQKLLMRAVVFDRMP